ncbi:protein phosphatase 1 regulatory subunit 3B [Trichomycterus rosablanca]|uniref:protein phosphatase 1 regulatory subunit 3B n=1 Tax=Trichomycterus rosablanca TaxID=2290929 RepID=UPI002F35E5B4
MMPVELAMPLFLSNKDFQSRKTAQCKGPLRPCFHPALRGAGAQREQSQPKKHVSFADHKGLALAVVKIFSVFDDPIEVPLSIQELFASALDISKEEGKLVLDFSQPSADYMRFRERLERDFVCLEHCVLKDRAVAGTVKVKNLSYEKAVTLRITFDTWKSHVDVDCPYVLDMYSGSGWDTFSFELDLPEPAPPHEQIEFAVFYSVNGSTYWDSNHGQNYKIIQSALKRSPSDSNHRHDSDWDVFFDRYGSPRCSHGIFPEWPSYAGYEDLGPYY